MVPGLEAAREGSSAEGAPRSLLVGQDGRPSHLPVAPGPTGSWRKMPPPTRASHTPSGASPQPHCKPISKSPPCLRFPAPPTSSTRSCPQHSARPTSTHNLAQNIQTLPLLNQPYLHLQAHPHHPAPPTSVHSPTHQLDKLSAPSPATYSVGQPMPLPG